MKKSALWLLSLLLVMSVFLAACSGGGEKASTDKEPKDDGKASGEAQEGGTVTFGYTQPFKGVLSYAYYEGEDDVNALKFMHEGIFNTSEELTTVPGLADWEMSEDNTKLTIKFKEGIKWHDGEELTVEDLEYAWYLIADPTYEGARFANVEMIKGAQEYKDGKADKIEGIKIIDDYTIEVTVKSPTVNLIDNIWSYPEPKHYYGDISSKELPDSDQIRKNPIGIGPFKVKNIVPGEMIEFERFDDYWQGKPKLDGIVYKIIDGSLAQGLVQNGEIDVIEAPKDQWETIKALDNVNPQEVDALSYSYIAFDWGHYDTKKGVVVSDNKKFQNKNLRHAMAHAIDRQAFIDGFANGLGKPLNTPFPSVSWAKIDESEINAYEFDQEKAKKLLDEAGYVDKDGDGFREDPEGKPFTINFDAMAGAETSEARAQFILQSWQEVGLNAKLNGGSLKDFNLFYDTIEADDPSVETFMGAWGLASDPDPAGIWLSTDKWNMWRWYSEESDALIKKGVTFPEDPSKDVKEHRQEIYNEWQKLVNEELPVIFFEQRVDAWAVNKRVGGVKLYADGVMPNEVYNWHIVE
ncbi:oligopeptide ABC transporter substrate-binding protein [Cytobacillus firmus]|uniref:oligopeptide ABC transporter substrate-binding protein n=1 Tax=Cytobacillus firmus TaxID=1399 RepID=UPI0018CD004A|nr:oligopeptide ABC transporter substrate-binding protein [Cytobacillus firmus]MBG9549937.1 peptide ABC transporter substrate-binding protein [Cytobacillus firmus]MBG9604587.1 peptide ABC transporter substrate-binding protein [Cytobacillus firmus]MED1940543.1 oligopeptide ABC transporter substrate-binding protein [Cytobacillus firmus]USK40280.1 oligopeptide ABC transporter substrate-binding protein [Cytobacillus firmus]